MGARYRFPMSNQAFLKRAFELAESGEFAKVSDIRKAMTQEGFPLYLVSQLSGRQLAQQLRTKILAARRTKQPGK